MFSVELDMRRRRVLFTRWGGEAVTPCIPSVADVTHAGRLSSDGVFLLENGVELLLWVGREANPAIISSLFGVPSLEGQDPQMLAIQVS